MIGVIADPADRDVVSEFFELFKTPWEFYRTDGRYEVLLCAGDGSFDASARFVLSYAGRKTQFDDERGIPVRCERRCSSFLLHQGDRIPIYGDSITFEKGSSEPELKDEETQECAAYLARSKDGVLARIGYDLFREVRLLLTEGQPAANASMPSLELHIAFLRNLIIECGISLVEIPPVPAGYKFIVCLTHDVDHPSIRRHLCDHTMFGFLYRAIFGSLRRLIRRQMAIRDLLGNWVAALKLPLIYMGLAKDFWRDFAGGYLELEKGLPSTFFVIPFKNSPGKGLGGPAPAFRAAHYEAQEIAGTIQNLLMAGNEVGLHGIDAWLDSSKGYEELQEIRRLTGVSETGVRMHWLYYNQQSAAVLEKAGAAYDSTIGYNETVGYRAGTTQAYKPIEAKQMLELPMHVMDTALFYPGCLRLSPQEATLLLGRMADNAAQHGGALTINWHDRSIASERLWGECYRGLVQDLKNRNAWFSTAGQATSWFRKRRSAVFETDGSEPSAVRVKVALDQGDSLPRLRLRVHGSRETKPISFHGSADYIDIDPNVACVASSKIGL